MLLSYNISNRCTGVHVSIHHDSDLLGLHAGLQRSFITYTNRIVSAVLLCTQLVWNK